MKKVVICVPSLAIGGAERFAVDLALALDKNKFRVIIAITRLNVDSYFSQLLEQNDVQIVNLAGKDYLSMLKKQLQFLKRKGQTLFTPRLDPSYI